MHFRAKLSLVLRYVKSIGGGEREREREEGAAPPLVSATALWQHNRCGHHRHVMAH